MAVALPPKETPACLLIRPSEPAAFPQKKSIPTLYSYSWSLSAISKGLLSRRKLKGLDSLFFGLILLLPPVTQSLASWPIFDLRKNVSLCWLASGHRKRGLLSADGHSSHLAKHLLRRSCSMGQARPPLFPLEGSLLRLFPHFVVGRPFRLNTRAGAQIISLDRPASLGSLPPGNC